MLNPGDFLVILFLIFIIVSFFYILTFFETTIPIYTVYNILKIFLIQVFKTFKLILKNCKYF